MEKVEESSTLIYTDEKAKNARRRCEMLAGRANDAGKTQAMMYIFLDDERSEMERRARGRLIC